MLSPTASPRCILVEDDIFAQRELAFFLSDMGFDVTCAGVYEEAQGILGAPALFRLAVVDLRLRRVGERRPTAGAELGLRLVRQIKRASPGTAVTIWTSYEDQVRAIAGMVAEGWSGLAYAVKGSAPEELRQAIDHALRGDVYFQRGLPCATPNASEALLAALPSPTAALVVHVAEHADALSPKEREVIERLTCSTESIAQQMHISPHTVRNYLDAIFTRCGLKDAPAAELRRDTVLVLAHLLRRLQRTERH